jgi:hypothetical protein
MPNYWHISDRAIRSGQPSSTEQGPLTYWTADALAGDGTIAWRKVTQTQFQTQLKAAADALNPNNDGEQEDQPHVTFWLWKSGSIIGVEIVEDLPPPLQRVCRLSVPAYERIVLIWKTNVLVRSGAVICSGGLRPSFSL